MKKIKKRFDAEEFERRNKPIGVLDKKLSALSADKSSLKKQKTLILCIDGVSLNKVKALILKGKLNNFKGLIKKGVSANTKSTIPPDSLPAWPSFTTGNNPAKHGIIEYFKYMKERDEYIVVNSNMINTKKYWDIFSDYGLTSVTMNLPLTFPPQEIKGIMISDHLTPQDAIFSYPSELCETLKEVGYFTQLVVTKFFNFDLTKPEPYIYKIKKTKEVALSIMKNYNWNLFTLGFMTPDKAHHMFGLDGKEINMIYETLDSTLGEILANIDQEKTDIFIVSDHGVSNYHKEFSLHSWLFKKGLIKLNSLMKQVKPLRSNWSKTDSLKNKDNFLYDFLLKILNVIYRLKIALNLPSLPFFNFPQEIINTNTANLCPFDWSRTKVYSLLPPTSNFLTIFINTQGERPFGIVRKGKDYQDLKTYLIRELNSLQDPYSREYIVDKIYEREELFSGKFLKEMPDLVVKLKKQHIGFSGFSDRKRIIKGPIFRNFKKPVLNHSSEGIFVFAGPKAKENVELKEDIDILDLFPSILYTNKLPVPEGIDGKIRKDIFKDEYVKETPVRRIAGENNQAKEEWLKKHSQKDLELLNEELKRLGYRR